MKYKKAYYNIVTKIIYQIVALVTGLITPRLILQSFGSTYNGAISSITQFLSMISVLTIGIAGAMRVELYKNFAQNDLIGTSKIVKATDKFFKKVGKILVIYTLFLAILFPVMLKDQLSYIDSALLVVILSLSTFGVYYFGQTYFLFLQADQSEYITTIGHIIVNIVNMFIVIFMVKAQFNIFAVKLACSVLPVIYPIIISRYVKSKYKLITDVDADLSLLGQRKDAMFHSIANIVHDNTDIILLTVFTNTKLISVYTVYYSIVLNVKQLFQNFTTGLEAAFGVLWAGNQKTTFKKNFEIYEFLSFSFSSVIFTCVGLLILPFIKLYTYGINDVNYIRMTFAILVTITEAVFCIRQPYVTIVQAAGKYKETKKGAFLEAVINLLVSLILVNFIGLNGVIMGTLVSNIFRTCQYACFSYKHLLQRNIVFFVKNICIHMLNTTLTVVIFNKVLQYMPINTWLNWIIEACICFAISLIVTLFNAFIFNKGYLVASFGVIKKMIK